MATILGDKTILSLLEVVSLDENGKQELLTLLPAMDEQDRLDIIRILYQLFALQTDNKIIKKQAQLFAEKIKNPQPLNLGEFAQVEEEILKEVSANHSG